MPQLSRLKFIAAGLLLHAGWASAAVAPSVQNLSGDWLFHQGHHSPHDTQDLDPSYYYFKGSADHDTVATFQVTATESSTQQGVPFTFQSVDLYSSVTNIPYQFVGTLGSQVVFTATGTAPSNFGQFLTVANSYASLAIDKLVVELTNPTSFGDGNPVGYKSVVINAATVPEPESLALLGMGLAVTVLVRRKAIISAQ